MGSAQSAHHISFVRRKSKCAPVLGEFLQLHSQTLEGILAPSPTHVSREVFISACPFRCDLFTQHQPSRSLAELSPVTIRESTSVRINTIQ